MSSSGVFLKKMPQGALLETPDELEKRRKSACVQRHSTRRITLPMAKIAKTGDRKKIMDTTKSTDCPKCSKPTRIVKRVKDRERGIPGGIYISCSACDFYEKL